MSNGVGVFSRFDRPARVKLICAPGTGKTHQSFKDECDVNLILDRYAQTGVWGNRLAAATRVPQFGDFVQALDFRESMNKVVEAQAEFDALPSRIRNRFHNNPEELMAFLLDAGNKAEAEKLGLIAPSKTEEAQTTPPATGAGAA